MCTGLNERRTKFGCGLFLITAPINFIFIISMIFESIDWLDLNLIIINFGISVAGIIIIWPEISRWANDNTSIKEDKSL